MFIALKALILINSTGLLDSAGLEIPGLKFDPLSLPICSILSTKYLVRLSFFEGSIKTVISPQAKMAFKTMLKADEEITNGKKINKIKAQVVRSST